MLGDLVLDTHPGDWATFAQSKLSPEHPLSREGCVPGGAWLGVPHFTQSGVIWVLDALDP